MNKLFLIFSILTIGYASAQNLTNLDSKYGINKFKLETGLDLYKNELQYKSTYEGLKLYEVKNLKSFKILGKSVSELSLTFYKNKLHSISIVLETYSKNDEMEVLKKLENLFGSSSKGEAGSSSTFSYEWAYVWKTDKVYLGYNKMSWDSEFKPGVCNIYMISLKLQQQHQNDSF